MMKQQTPLIITLALIGLFSLTLSAQMIINVEGVGTIKGNLANFEQSNPCEIDSIFAPIRIANDQISPGFACDSFVDVNLDQKIALINMFDCNDDDERTNYFESAAANCEANGALAVVICHDKPGRRPVGPYYSWQTLVSIPTILVSQEECSRLTTALNESIEISASLYFDDISNPPNRTVYWGDEPGQGEFEGGLNEWTVENCYAENFGLILDPDPVTWLWYDNPIEERFSSQLVSYSRCNGAIGFDATEWNIDNSGSISEISYATHHCELISPIIDLSNADQVSLQFWQVNFSFQGNDNPTDPVSRIFISTDGGENYTEKIDVTTDNVLTSTVLNWANEELKRYFLPELSGEPNVRLKFEFHGDFYAWYIDDVFFTGNDTEVALHEASSMTNLKLFPNPASNEISIEVEFKSSDNNLEISITDIMGRIQDIQNHSKVSNGAFSFDLTQYNNGVYFAKIKTEEGITTKRFVISKY